MVESVILVAQQCVVITVQMAALIHVKMFVVKVAQAVVMAQPLAVLLDLLVLTS